MSSGGRCDFDDGGSYAGTWRNGMSHGHGICTGPMGQGEYAGSWHMGFEVSGVYTWTSGNYYEGQWLQGKRHGLGVEQKGHWLYRGEWTQGYKGRYGIRQSTTTGLKFEGTWTAGLQDGYGVETYADGGTFQGQWLRGHRHGYGIRQSVSYDLAAHYQTGALPSSTLTLSGGGVNDGPKEDEAALHDRDRRMEESRGGFVLLARTTPDEADRKKRLLLDKHGRPSIRKTMLGLIRQKSTGDIQEQLPPRSGSRQSGGSVRSTVSTITQSSGASGRTTGTGSAYGEDDEGSFISQTDLDQGGNVVERYLGEWKNDRRSGYGICERSDGLKYEGEWFNNKKYGYGVTTLRDGSRLEGKYKNNVLVSSGRSSKLFLLRSSKIRDRVESAVLSAHKAADIAKQKADIANARMTSARVKCEQAEEAAKLAAADADMARAKAREFSPNARHPGEKIIANRLQEEELLADYASYDVSADQSLAPIQPQMSPKKFSFFKFKKDSSRVPLPMSSVAQPPVLQTAHGGSALSATPKTNRDPARPAFASNSPHYQPSATNQFVGNDFRSAHQAVFQSLASPPAHDRFVADADHSRIERPRISTTGQSNFYQPIATPPGDYAGNHGFVTDVLLQGQISPTRVFDDAYNWVGYGELRERRKSLPSIVKDKEPSFVSDEPLNVPETTKGGSVGNHTLQSQRTAPSRHQSQLDTYVIENGVRKKVKPLYSELAPHKLTSSDEKGAKNLLSKKLYELESPKMYRKGEKGSLPDVSAVKDVDVLPREVVYVMSQQRREALIRERADEERRRRNQIVLRLGDLKEWCQRRQVLVLILALNISLATVFYHMLI